MWTCKILTEIVAWLLLLSSLVMFLKESRMPLSAVEERIGLFVPKADPWDLQRAGFSQEHFGLS